MIRPVRVDELELGTNLVRGDLGLQVIHHILTLIISTQLQIIFKYPSHILDSATVMCYLIQLSKLTTPNDT